MTRILTPGEVDAIEARANAATPGPWEWKQPGYPDDLTLVLTGAEGREVLRFNSSSHRDNTQFIAHAREDIPDLIATVRALRAEVKALRDWKTDISWKLSDVTETQCRTGNWDYDEYMHGLANGLRLAESLVLDCEYVPKSAPEKWLRDVVLARADGPVEQPGGDQQHQGDHDDDGQNP